MIRSIPRASFGLGLLLLTGFLLASQDMTLAQEKAQKKEATKARHANTITLELKPLSIYDIKVATSDCAVNTKLSSPQNAKSNWATNGEQSAVVTPGKQTEYSSFIRHMPQAEQGGKYKLEISSGDSKKPLLNYTVTIKVQVTS